MLLLLVLPKEMPQLTQAHNTKFIAKTEFPRLNVPFHSRDTKNFQEGPRFCSCKNIFNYCDMMCGAICSFSFRSRAVNIRDSAAFLIRKVKFESTVKIRQEYLVQIDSLIGWQIYQCNDKIFKLSRSKNGFDASTWVRSSMCFK